MISKFEIIFERNSFGKSIVYFELFQNEHFAPRAFKLP
jgi:hypothetical protein